MPIGKGPPPMLVGGLAKALSASRRQIGIGRPSSVWVAIRCTVDTPWMNQESDSDGTSSCDGCELCACSCADTTSTLGDSASAFGGSGSSSVAEDEDEDVLLLEDLACSAAISALSSRLIGYGGRGGSALGGGPCGIPAACMPSRFQLGWSKACSMILVSTWQVRRSSHDMASAGQ